MSITILCSFDDVDLADLAAGRLRAKIPEIKSLDVSRPDIKDPQDTGFFPMLGSAAAASGMSGSAGPVVPLIPNMDMSTQTNHDDFIPQSATLRLVCPEECREAAEAQLLGLGAMKIRVLGSTRPPS